MPRSVKSKPSTLKFSTQSSLDSYVWGICNILRRSNCAGALQYVPELTWILFLRILDDTEAQEAERAEAVGADFDLHSKPHIAVNNAASMLCYCLEVSSTGYKDNAENP